MIKVVERVDLDVVAAEVAAEGGGLNINNPVSCLRYRYIGTAFWADYFSDLEMSSVRAKR